VNGVTALYRPGEDERADALSCLVLCLLNHYVVVVDEDTDATLEPSASSLMNFAFQSDSTSSRGASWPYLLHAPASMTTSPGRTSLPRVRPAASLGLPIRLCPLQRGQLADDGKDATFNFVVET
jgi:hypothetical protein